MWFSVGVDFEGHLNLWLSTWSWGDAAHLELAKHVVVLGHWALTLEDHDVHSRLVVLVGGEDLRLLGGDDSVAADELGHHATHGLNSKSQWSDIEEQKILTTLTAQDSGLDCSAIVKS